MPAKHTPRRIRPQATSPRGHARQAVDDVRESVTGLLARFAADRQAATVDDARLRSQDLDAISARVAEINAAVADMMDDLGQQRRELARTLRDELADHAASIASWVEDLREASARAASQRADERHQASRQAAEDRAGFVAELLAHCAALRDQTRELAEQMRSDREHAAASDALARADDARRRQSDTAELLASFRNPGSVALRPARPRDKDARPAHSPVRPRSSAYTPSIPSAFVPLPPPPSPPPAHTVATTRSPMAGIGKATRKPRRR